MPDSAPTRLPEHSTARPRPGRLVVTDVDSTFLTQEVIELIAEHAGTREQVAAVTERAMRGELDFADSLRERVATLAGVPVSALDAVREAVVLTPGAEELVAEVRRRGWEFGLVSGGFAEVLEPLATSLGITRWRANRLEAVDGVLTGRTTGPVVDRALKEATLRQWTAELGLSMADTVAVGDGANDLDMIDAAGIGIAFAAKPAVRARAPYSLDGPRLDAVLRIVDTVDGRRTAADTHPS
ncbi:phosphoserine phosphatase SerB [Isoptericola sp. b515]|uniref:phosphoserine phosphatase SerB n=1 Tax=Isoptericola sp. b515 TaxID=3064652 RepID=UPI0027123780|nr:phosphoserine phosphatase SerB [Isoptericola sp. b515]MDO8149535.1 phosphoserine phosphatase SerB [Isoptericola sp. b515]